MSRNILPLIPPELLQYTLLHEASLSSRPEESTSLLRFLTKPGHTFGEGYRRIYIGAHPDDDYAYVGDTSSGSKSTNRSRSNKVPLGGRAAGPSSARNGLQGYNQDDSDGGNGDDIDDNRSFLIGIDTLWKLDDLYTGDRKGKGKANVISHIGSARQPRKAVNALSEGRETNANGHVQRPDNQYQRTASNITRNNSGSQESSEDTASDASDNDDDADDDDEGSSHARWQSAQSSLRQVKTSVQQKPSRIKTSWLKPRAKEAEMGSDAEEDAIAASKRDEGRKGLGSPDGLFVKLHSKDDKKRLSSGTSQRKKTMGLDSAQASLPQGVLSRRAMDSPATIENGSASGMLSEDSAFVGANGLRSLDKKVSDKVKEEVRQLSEPTVEPETEKRHELLRRVSDTLLPETASDTFLMSSGNRNEDLLASGSALKRPDARQWKSSKSVTWNTSHPGHVIPASKALELRHLPNGSGDKPADDPSKVLLRPDPLEQPAEETPPDIPTLHQLTRVETSESLKALGKLAATKEASLPPGVEKLERMIVRTCWTSREGFPDEFDERAARHFTLKWKVWEEVAVIWKKHHLEVYGTHHDPFHRFMTKSLDLRYMIPLNNTKTRLSVYSMADQIFCIRCPPHPLGGRHRSGKSGLRNKRHINTEGTNLFLFRARSTSIAQDWYLGLHMALNKYRVDTLEVHLPGLGIRVRLPTNAEAHDTASPSIAVSATRDLMKAGLPDRDLVSKEEMLQSIRDLVSNRSDWKELLESLENRHIQLRLAWRKGPILEWLSFDRSVDGVRRIWDVYTGAIMKQATEAVHRLEALPEIHHPTYVSLANGVHLIEPPSVEGYISRLRYRNEGQRERLYLGTFGRVLYIFRGSRAQLPPFPTADHLSDEDADMHPPATDTKAAELLKTFGKEENVRLESMLIRCRGVILLRDIKSVDLDDTCQHCAGLPGEQPSGLKTRAGKKPQDHNHLIVQITLADDKTFRFETLPKDAAREWVGRLGGLVEYWTKRERADAKVQLSLSAFPSSQAVSQTKASEMLPFQRRDIEDSATQTDLDEQLLSQAFHFCIQKGCRYNIHMQSRLYYKKGHRDAIFFDRFIVLVDNHLMIFETFKRNFSKRPVPLVYHRRLKTIHLKDVYVVTGEGCSQFFRDVGRTGYNPSHDQNSLARVYKDGLISVDDPMDSTFMLWRQRSKATTTQLGRNGKAYLFRARSKLERDQWVQAFNVMCENYGRTTREREIRLATFSQIK